MEELGGVYFSVVTFNGFGHDDGGGVAALDGLGSGGDRAGDVAAGQEEGQDTDDQQNQ